jgi:glycerate kinase
MRVVVAPDSFKGVLDARGAAMAIARGIRRARPGAEVELVPLADGGEGTLDVLLSSGGGSRRRVAAHGPLGEARDVEVGLVQGASTAVIEMARVAGYALVPPEQRNPLATSTFGLGEVLRATIEGGIERVILAIGGSATVDGGAGMMQGLGVQFFDSSHGRMAAGLGGGDLRRIGRFTWPDPPEGVDHVVVTIAADVLNPACGPNGAAAVFGPQKGADESGVRVLEEGLAHWADLLEAYSRRAIRDEPGTGAAGGVALPLLALMHAAIVPGVDLVSEAVGLAGRMARADLVITGEGRLDRQSLMGKVVGAVGRMAGAAGVSCVAIVGAAGAGAEDCLGVLDRYVTLDGPLQETEARLSARAEQLATELL